MNIALRRLIRHVRSGPTNRVMLRGGCGQINLEVLRLELCCHEKTEQLK